MILLSILFLIIGFIGLTIGSKFIIIGLENIADRLHISHMMVGLTILAIGTSLPEIAVSVMGGLDKLLGIDTTIDGIVIGNKVGSFLTQITLIIGLLAVAQPLMVSKWELRREGPMLFISLLTFLIFSLDGVITQFEALLMIISYFVYLILIIWSEKRLARAKPEVRFADKERLDPMSFDPIESPHKISSSLFKDISFTLIGLLILLVTAEFTLLSAHDLAREFNIPENVIGILIVGFGTSLPELVADLTAIRRGSYGIAIGDILGSNICYILLATGSGAIIVSFNVPMVILIFDLPVLFLALTITIYLLWTHKTLKKWEGALLIGFYGVYVIVKLLFFQI